MTRDPGSGSGVGSGFSVVPSALVSHAGAVEVAAAAMEQAAAAGEVVAAGAGAYGKLCAFLPLILNPFQQATVEVLRGSGESLGSAAVELRASAATYEGHEAANAAEFGRVGSGLGG